MLTFLALTHVNVLRILWKILYKVCIVLGREIVGPLFIVVVISGIIFWTLLPQPFPRTSTSFPGVECPVPLPLHPLYHQPVQKNDPLLSKASKELSDRLNTKLFGIDSAVVIVVHGGQNILEWSHGRIRSNVSQKEDSRKADANTIWRIASITKVRFTQ